jgi:cell division protease FtsH
MGELEEAIERVTAGLEKKKRLISPREKKIVAYHEAGHAVVASALQNADPIRRISIVPRGVASLGHTSQFPTEDRYLLSRTELEERIAILLGGREAEELLFGDVTTGAQNDLQLATDIARAMVKKYGMSRKLGVMAYDRPQSPFLRSEQWMPSETDYSEEAARQIDEEIRSLLQRGCERARGILAERKVLLDRVVDILLKQEVVNGHEFAQMVEEYVSNSLRKGETA